MVDNMEFFATLGAKNASTVEELGEIYNNVHNDKTIDLLGKIILKIVV